MQQVSIKKLHTKGFHFHNILEKTKQYREQTSDCQRFRGGEEADYKGIPEETPQRTLAGVETALYPDYGVGYMNPCMYY